LRFKPPKRAVVTFKPTTHGWVVGYGMGG